MARRLIEKVLRWRVAFVVVLVILISGTTHQAHGVSFALDSIAAWGKFPKFCIDVYRWGDRFFNTYDSAYVVGTGTKFNIKLTADSWLDYYRFVLPGEEGTKLDNRFIDLISRPSTSVGIHLTYLAVSVGYDINLSSIFRGVKESRQRYQFGFNCALFAAEAYKEINSIGTRMTRFGTLHPDIPYDGMHSNSWGIDAYYFFNNKRYSQAAAFSFSKIQLRSQGSFYAGLSIYSQNYDFDFSRLEKYLLDKLPAEWEDHHFISHTSNYGIRAGYAFNWVFAKNWLLGISISPTIGIKHGYTNSSIKRTSFSLYNHAQMSVVWNCGRWFAGIIGSANTAVVSSRQTTFLGNTLSVTGAVGWRFNLW